jgi:hypothetical protein
VRCRNKASNCRKSWHGGDKSKYTKKQDRQAAHIAESYESRGVSHKEAERRAWATVNAEAGGGQKTGSGHGRAESRAPSRKDGKLGGHASTQRSSAEKSASARKAAAIRRRHASHHAST